jgi:GT2 family glycosyltransferase
LIVNSDAEVPLDCVGRLAQALDDHPEAGIVAPLLLARADPTFVASAGFAFSARSGRARQAGFGRRRAELSLASWQTVTAASGCVMLLRRALLERIGLFDEELFFSFEDLELCLRARQPASRWPRRRRHVLHEGGAVESSPRLYFATRNHLLAAASRRSPTRSRWLGRSPSWSSAHVRLTSAGPLSARLGAWGAGALDAARGRLGARGWAPRRPLADLR